MAGLQDSPGCNLGQLLLRTACDVELLCFPCRPMESQADTPSSQSVESCSLDLPAACDFRGREAAPEASQGTSSKSLSSLESHSFPCSSTADPGNKKSLNRTNFSNNWQRHRHVVVLFLHLEGVSFLSHVERHFTQQHCGEGLQRNLPE